MAVRDLRPQYQFSSGVYNQLLVSSVYEALRSPTTSTSTGGSTTFRAHLANIPDNLLFPTELGDGSGTRISKIVITDDWTKLGVSREPPVAAASAYADGGLVIYLSPRLAAHTGAREATLAEVLVNEIADWTSRDASQVHAVAHLPRGYCDTLRKAWDAMMAEQIHAIPPSAGPWVVFDYKGSRYEATQRPLARGAQLKSNCQDDGSLRISGPRKRR